LQTPPSHIKAVASGAKFPLKVQFATSIKLLLPRDWPASLLLMAPPRATAALLVNVQLVTHASATLKSPSVGGTRPLKIAPPSEEAELPLKVLFPTTNVVGVSTEGLVFRTPELQIAPPFVATLLMNMQPFTLSQLRSL
jgi:hypothetical protein